ncbi:MAG TPA: response regulator, partial [Mycobacteriales bacterium]|nr:response regulator [Mycobacteriales bacterium]
MLLASEHLIIREGLRKLLEAEPGVVVVGDVSDPHEALTVTRAVKPHVVIIGFSGRPLIRTLRSLRQLAPAGEYGRAIVLAARIDNKHMAQALQLGAGGILLKDTSARVLVESIRTVAAGERVSPSKNGSADGNGGLLHPVRERDGVAQAPQFGLTSREL